MSKNQEYAIVADGEGAQACIIADGEIHEAIHKFMCMCGKPWRDCDPSMIADIEQIDDTDNWQKDERGEPFSISWPHETGCIAIYRLSPPAVSKPESVPPERWMELAVKRVSALTKCECAFTSIDFAEALKELSEVYAPVAAAHAQELDELDRRRGVWEDNSIWLGQKLRAAESALTAAKARIEELEAKDAAVRRLCKKLPEIQFWIAERVMHLERLIAETGQIPADNSPVRVGSRLAAEISELRAALAGAGKGE